MYFHQFNNMFNFSIVRVDSSQLRAMRLEWNQLKDKTHLCLILVVSMYAASAYNSNTTGEKLVRVQWRAQGAVSTALSQLLIAPLSNMAALFSGFTPSITQYTAKFIAESVLISELPPWPQFLIHL